MLKPVFSIEYRESHRTDKLCLSLFLVLVLGLSQSCGITVEEGLEEEASSPSLIEKEKGQEAPEAEDPKKEEVSPTGTQDIKTSVTPVTQNNQSELTCTVEGQIPQWNKETGQWICGTLDQTLGNLGTCADGSIPVKTLDGWKCDEDRKIEKTNILSELKTSLGKPCPEGSVPKWDGNSWTCEEDLFEKDTVIPKTQTLQDLAAKKTCKDGEALKWKADQWSCETDFFREKVPKTDKLREFSCTAEDQVLTWDGTDWSCASDIDTTLATGKQCDSGDALVQRNNVWQCLSLGYRNDIILDLVVGYRRSCALFGDGSLKCWGQNDNGELGLGDTNNRGDEANEMGDNLPAIELGSNAQIKQIISGIILY